jgi:mannose-6-phosphate isomerase-like protein (cupin superfamily)
MMVAAGSGEGPARTGNFEEGSARVQEPTEAEIDKRLSAFINGEMSDYSYLPPHKKQGEKFSYFLPELGKRDRIMKKLCLTDLVFAGVQLLKPGAENVMHSHSGMDGIYFVLKGRMIFYGENDSIIGELGPMEGVVMPRGTPYWMKAVGDETVEMLHIEAFDKRVPNKKTRYAPEPPNHAIEAL